MNAHNSTQARAATKRPVPVLCVAILWRNMCAARQKGRTSNGWQRFGWSGQEIDNIGAWSLYAINVSAGNARHLGCCQASSSWPPQKDFIAFFPTFLCISDLIFLAS
eukprot:1698152-Amphidinium_carterae.1